MELYNGKAIIHQRSKIPKKRTKITRKMKIIKKLITQVKNKEKNHEPLNNGTMIPKEFIPTRKNQERNY